MRVDHRQGVQERQRPRRQSWSALARLVALVGALLLAPALAAPVAAQIELNSGEVPGSVLVFPKFVRGTVQVGQNTGPPATPIVEPKSAFAISVTCPAGQRCGEGERVKLRARWICPATQDPTQKLVCRATDFELFTTVKGTIWFNPENAGSRTVDVGRPPCQRGFLLVWVVSPNDADAPRAIKYDGLIGTGMLRGSDATLSAYNAYPIQAVSRLAHLAGTDANGDGRLQFDGATEYKAVTGQVRGSVRFERSAGPVNTDLGPITTSLSLLTLDTIPNRPNFPTFVDLHFFNEDETLLSTFHEFVCWSQVRLTDIDPNLDEFFGQKGLIESTEAEKAPIFGISDTAGPVTLLGLVETIELDSGGADQRQYSYSLLNDGRPISTARVVQILAPGSGESVSGTINLQAVAQDSSGGIQRVEFYIDTETSPVCADLTTRPSGSTFQCSWNSGSRPSGPHAVRARALSIAGDVFDSAAVSFTIAADSVAPTSVQVVTPTPGEVIGGDVTLQATAQDNSGVIQRVEFLLDGGTTPLCADTTPRGNGALFQCAWNPSGTANGLHSIRARAYDPAGNGTSSSPVAITINYAEQLAVVVSGSGNVRSVPAGIDCSTSCMASFDYGRQVTLTPTAAVGWRFAGWSGACSGTGACVVTMTQDASVTATFARETFRLTVAVTGTGTVTSSPAVISCPGTCAADVPSGTVVTLSATPGSSATFVGWSGACSGTGGCAVTLSAARTVSAEFHNGPTTPLGSFVDSLYSEILNRPASPDEIEAWIQHLRNSAQPEGAAQMIRGFFDSQENLNRPITLAQYVRLLYRILLDREPAQAEIDAWVAIIATRFNLLIPGFVNSPEFQELSLRTPPATVIQRLYQQTLHRAATAAEVAAWVDVFARNGGDWVAISVGFLNSPEYLNTPRTFGDHVIVLYRTFLGREPSPAEVNAWVAILLGYLKDIQDGFIYSPEFMNRIQALLR